MNGPEERSHLDHTAAASRRVARAVSEEAFPDDDEEGVDLGRFLTALVTYKWLILAIVAIATTATGYYASNEPPKYRAVAEILLNPPEPNVSAFQEVRRQPAEFQPETEAALLRSRDLAREAVDRLNLRENLLFTSGESPERNRAVAALKRQLTSAFDDAATGLSGTMARPADSQTASTGSSSVTRPANPAPPVAVLAERYIEGLSVRTSGESRILRVIYTSSDPEFTATAANATAELYIERKREAQGRAVQDANTWLQERVREARDNLLRSERELEDMRQSEGLSESAATSMPSQQLARLNDRLLDAQTEASQLRTRLEQARTLMSDKATLENVGQILESDLIQRLRVQRLNLNQEIAKLKTRYLEKHPKIQNARAEMSNINEKIHSEARSITRNIAFELKVHEERISRIKRQISGTEDQVQKLREAEGRIRTLESEVEANRDLYRTLLKRLQQTNLQEQLKPRAEASIINRAQTPPAPFYPNEKVFVSAALLGSGMLACALAIGLEFMRRGVGSLSELKGKVDLEALGAIPWERPERGGSLVSTAGDLRLTPYVDSLRRLRQTMVVRDHGATLPCILVTSAWPGEGKTTVARSLAALNSALGRSCVVVECHLGEGHELRRSEHDTGWIQHLEYNKALDDVLQTDTAGQFHILPAGRTTEQAYDLQASEAFPQLLNRLRETYDTIIVDAPSILDDTRILAHPESFDYTLLLVRANSTPIAAISYATRQMHDVGLSEVGAALTMVNMRDYDRRESGEYRATLDRPSRRLVARRTFPVALPMAAGALTFLGAVAMIVQRLLAIPPE